MSDMRDEDAEETPSKKSSRQPRMRAHLRTGRLEAFSDGVFAIAVTLLVLSLTVPAGSRRDLLGAFLGQWPSYLVYVVSFSTIGALWLGHSLITDYLELADTIFVRLNLLFLLIVSFLPFPTRLLGNYIGLDTAERVATTIYGLTLLVALGLLSLLWRYALHARLVRPDAADEELTALTQWLTPGLAGYAILIGLGLLVPVVAVVGYLLLALFFIYPFRGHRRRRSVSRR